MGLRDRLRGGDAPGRRYRMREDLLSIGDDYWIEDEASRRVFKVDGKAVRDTMAIERAGGGATVHKALVGLRDRFKIDVEGGPDLSAHGNLVDHEYEIERNDDTVATVSRKWFRVRDTYGVEIAPGQDDALILAITVCIDAMARD